MDGGLCKILSFSDGEMRDTLALRLKLAPEYVPIGGLFTASRELLFLVGLDLGPVNRTQNRNWPDLLADSGTLRDLPARGGTHQHKQQSLLRSEVAQEDCLPQSQGPWEQLGTDCKINKPSFTAWT